MIRFNIVTPTYNDAHKYLIDTIASVSGQFFDKTKIEVIHTIVDDGSDSVEALALIEKLYDLPSVNIISQRNCGLPAARNTAINAIQSDYILPLDSDDLIHPCLIQQFYEWLVSCAFPRNALVAPNMLSFGAYKRRISIRTPSLYTICRANYLPVSTLFSTDSAINHPYDERMIYGLEDWELWIRLISNGHYVHNLNTFGFFHREHLGNMTHSTLKNIPASSPISDQSIQSYIIHRQCLSCAP